jgi:hypothetical protein
MLASAAPSPALQSLYLFSTALAVGCALPLLLLPAGLMDRRFFVLMSLLGLVFYAVGLVAAGGAMSPFHGPAAALLIAYNVSLPRRRPAEGRSGATARLLALAAALSGGIGLVSDGLADAARLPALGSSAGPCLAAAAVGSSALLGGAVGAMVLGHFYLVVRGLPFSLLRRAVLLIAAALVLRAGAAAAAAALEWPRFVELWERLGPAGFGASYGLFITARLLFGLLVPAGLVVLAASAVKARSNTSATGIFYVVVAFVFIGEIIARHLVSSAGILL